MALLTTEKLQSFLHLNAGDTHLLLHLEFHHHRIAMELASTPEDPSSLITPVQAEFPHAVITGIKECGAAREDWPLEITRFHCLHESGRWHFVLDCPTIQWRWTSAWPLVRMESYLNRLLPSPPLPFSGWTTSGMRWKRLARRLLKGPRPPRSTHYS